jgi:hypothetical protein
MNRAFGLAGLLFSVGIANAQLPPTFSKVLGVSAENQSITVAQVVSKAVPMTESYTVDVNGRTEMRTRTIMKPVFETVQSKVSLANAAAYDGAGQRLSEEQLWRRLKPNEVIVTAIGQLPDAAFLNLLRKDAVVIVLPNMAPPATPRPTVNPTPVPATLPPRTDAPNPDVAWRHVLDGRIALVRRQYADAIAHFREAAAAIPGEPAPLYYLAYAQSEAGDRDAAEETVREAARMEVGYIGEPFGFEWERFQGPSRTWLAAARSRALDYNPRLKSTRSPRLPY